MRLVLASLGLLAIVACSQINDAEIEATVEARVLATVEAGIDSIEPVRSFADGEAIAVVQTWLASRSLDGSDFINDCLGFHNLLDSPDTHEDPLDASGAHVKWTETATGGPSYVVKHTLDNGTEWSWQVFTETRAIRQMNFTPGVGVDLPAGFTSC